MNDSEEIFAQIKLLCLSITETTYDTGIQQGYELLVRLRDLGLEKESVYPYMELIPFLGYNKVINRCCVNIL